MEDILALYTQPANTKRPLVCMDEVPKQLLSDVRDPLPAQPGQSARVDYEYQRQGVANLFMFFEPFRGQRQVKVTDTRTRLDWAEAMRELSDEIHPEAEKIIVVLHGSWLNMAEIELSVLSRQCINRRIPNEETLNQEVQAWVNERNSNFVKVDWRFSTVDARIKLKRLYPMIHD